jgi:hypothetical protein
VVFCLGDGIYQEVRKIAGGKGRIFEYVADRKSFPDPHDLEWMSSKEKKELEDLGVQVDNYTPNGNTKVYEFVAKMMYSNFNEQIKPLLGDFVAGDKSPTLLIF